MQENEAVRKENTVGEGKMLKSNIACIIYAQSVTAIIIILSILVIKLTLPDIYTTIRKNYVKHFTVETSVDDVLSDIQGDEKNEI